MNKQITIYVNNDKVINVEMVYKRGLPGRREFGAPIEPDDDDEIGIVEAWDEDGNEVELTDEQEEMAYDEFNK